MLKPETHKPLIRNGDFFNPPRWTKAGASGTWILYLFILGGNKEFQRVIAAG